MYVYMYMWVPNSAERRGFLEYLNTAEVYKLTNEF